MGAAALALETASNVLFAASVGSGLGGLYGIASAKLRGADTAKGFLAGVVVGVIAGALGASEVFLELPIAGAIYNSDIIVYSVAFGATQGRPRVSSIGTMAAEAFVAPWTPLPMSWSACSLVQRPELQVVFC